jgi:hypothetical protein
MTNEEVAALIKRRRLQLLIHSCIYYGMDQNLIDDSTFDKWSDELVKLQAEYPEVSKQVEWYDAFKDWDGSTGAFLPLNDTWVISKAKYLVSISKR